MRTRHIVGFVFLLAAVFASPGWAGQDDDQKMEPLARERARLTTGWSRVIVQATGPVSYTHLTLPTILLV